MEMSKLLDLAQAYADLGDAVQQQACMIVEHAEGDTGVDLTVEVSPNAAAMIADWAARCHNAGVADARLLLDTALQLSEVGA